MTTLAPVSVLLTTYHRTRPEDLTWALRSLQEQTLPAAQVVIVADGPIGEDLRHIIEDFTTTYSATGGTAHSVFTPRNQGSAAASNEGLPHCTEEFIARLDSDDLAAPTRFEKQIQFLRGNPTIDVLGTSVAEFDDALWASWIKNKDAHTAIHTLTQMGTTSRVLPETHRQIVRYARINSPLNHPSVMMRREALEEVGGYQPVHLMEDYDLWARMIAAGKTLHNLPEPLTYFRASEAMFDRRTGKDMFAAERVMQANLRRYGLISRPRAILNLLARSLYRALPRTTLTRVYSILFHR
ncbi:glycosyltransferase [Corynebacterium sp. zg254]|uniref:Glycosyltransferase n=1 Tax=Corynebacterium zhongnanshanii TaxID=2768834 RepID=A0ABQ6VDZ5_9CORY|nr:MULTISPECIES: glycosyltransferase [Corynebacterium]KAB3522667.1 glycosyltransferase [Corynebacterium zhongnanshanii]MCR5914285.1 glycosyltransferase [Corynebacterium sp. zg254]